MALPEQAFHPRGVYDGELNHFDVKPIWFLTKDEIQRRMEDPHYEKIDGRLTCSSWFEGSPRDPSNNLTLPEQYLWQRYIKEDEYTPVYLKDKCCRLNDLNDWNVRDGAMRCMWDNIINHMKYKETDLDFAFECLPKDAERVKEILRKWGLVVTDKKIYFPSTSNLTYVNSTDPADHFINVSWEDWSVERFTNGN